MKIGTMADSMGVYLPAKVAQKLLGLARVLLFIWLVSGEAELALWGLGVAVFSLVAPLATLGSPNALARYASLYEAPGLLRGFCRNATIFVLGCTALTIALAFASSDWITHYVLASLPHRPDLDRALLRAVCWVALGNAALLSLHMNLMSILYGLRAYRLVAVMELTFGVLFTLISSLVLLAWPTGLAVLVCHMLCLAAVTLGGAGLLWLGLNRLEASAPPLPADAGSPSQAGAGTFFGRVVWFGLVALAANTLWGLASSISLWLTNRHLDKQEAGVYTAFQSVAQPVLLLADAAWSVVFSHVARRWENRDRPGAMFTLEAAYKTVAIVLMTVTVAIYLASPLWIRILPAAYRPGLPLLAGLLLFYQSVIHLALLTMLAKLHERPYVIALAAAGVIALNYILGVTWTLQHGAAGAAWAAGVGCLAGTLAAAAVYLLLCRVRLTAGSWLLQAAPALLLLPAWATGVGWLLVVAAALATPLVFTRAERPLLAAQLASVIRRVKSWR